MNPPFEATYDDVDALKVACVQHAAAHFYSVTTKRSNYKMGVLLLHCGKSGTRDDRHGLTEETRQCPSSSVLTNCPFLPQGHRNRVGSWTLRVKCGEHNHPPLTREAAHQSHLKMTNDVKKRVCTLSAAGVAPAQILTLICSEPLGEHVVARDVYNLKRQYRIEQLDGWTPMEALLSSLIERISGKRCGATRSWRARAVWGNYRNWGSRRGVREAGRHQGNVERRRRRW